MSGIDARVEAVLARHVGQGAGAVTPGAVVIVERGGRQVVRTARGLAQATDCGRPLRRPLDLDTAFDLASITKVAVTTAALMRLVGESEVGLDTPLSALLPQFAGPDKDRVTLARLLRHDSGLEPWQPVYLHALDRRSALQWVAARDLVAPPGQRHAYSDLGFALLGAALEALTGLRLDEVARRFVLAPLGMDATDYRPRGTAAADGRTAIAATSCGDEQERRMIETGDPYPVEGRVADFAGWRERALVGEANDGNCFHAFEGVAGHAGLFAPARDLLPLGRAVLAGARGKDNALAPPPVVQRFLEPTGWPRQALGWWIDPGGAETGGRLIGHSGFTGGRFAVAPDDDSVIVLLANRQQLGFPPPDITPLWRDLVAVCLGAA